MDKKKQIVSNTEQSIKPNLSDIIAPLKLMIEHSNEAQALLNSKGHLLFKNSLFTLEITNKQLALPESINSDLLLEYQQHMLKLLPLSDDLILVKTLQNLPATQPKKSEYDLKGMANKNDLMQALAQAETANKNRLLIVIKITFPDIEEDDETQSPLSRPQILQTLAQLLNSCWRTGDQIFYLDDFKFAILYNNVPDMPLVRSRLANLDNVMHYKGYKKIKTRIGHSTLEQAEMQASSLLELAQSALHVNTHKIDNNKSEPTDDQQSPR